jgi:hypothetical protein
VPVRDPGPGRRPPMGAGSVAAVRVLVLEDPVDHVGHGLESPVGVPGGALGLTRGVVHLTHLVHVNEWIKGTEIHAAKARRTGKPSPFSGLLRPICWSSASRRLPRRGSRWHDVSYGCSQWVCLPGPRGRLGGHLPSPSSRDNLAGRPVGQVPDRGRCRQSPRGHGPLDRELPSRQRTHRQAPPPERPRLIRMWERCRPSSPRAGSSSG